MKPGRLRAVRWTGASIVFQGAMHALNPVQRIGDQIAEAIMIHGQASEREALVRVGGAARAGRAAPAADQATTRTSCPGGQKQRVMIAMALACSPSLVIADEPTTALDVMVQAQVLKLLKALQRELGLAMLFITHDLSVLVEVSDRLAIMYAGKIVEEGAAREVFTVPKHPYTEALAAAFPSIGDSGSGGNPSGLGGDPPDPAGDPERLLRSTRGARTRSTTCPTIVPELYEAGPGRRAACLLIRRGRRRRGRRAGRTIPPSRRTSVSIEPEMTDAGARAPEETSSSRCATSHVTFAGRVGLVAGLMGRKGNDAARRSTGSRSSSGAARSSRSRANRGAARPRPRARSWACSSRTSGEILFEGKPVRNLRKFRRRVQMVFQDPMGSLNPRQTIYEIVAEGLRIHGIHSGPNGETEEQLVARALSRAGMRPPERFYLAYPHELSGGQRQRVVIAGALVLEPEVIVADEPVSNLDASVRGEILRLLLKLRDEDRISIIIVTHDLGLAWTIADRVAVMYLGRIVEIGPAEDVLTRPHAPVHAGAARRRPRGRGDRPPDPGGRAARPDADPAGVPVPSAVPGGALGGGGGRSASRTAAADRTSGSTSCGPVTPRRATSRRRSCARGETAAARRPADGVEDEAGPGTAGRGRLGTASRSSSSRPSRRVLGRRRRPRGPP